jgi:transposase InsO family protein
MEFSVSVMCDVFSVSRSDYYAHLKRPVSKRKQADTELLEKIRIIHRNSDGSYGSPRVYRDLKEQGDTCGENRVARLMREDGLRSKTKRRFKATTDSKHNLPIAPNLLNREFNPEKPNEVYAGDITYIWTAEGWLYLAVVIDLFSRAVVGWAMDKRMTRQLVMNALTMAVQRRRPPSGIIFHSDRGSLPIPVKTATHSGANRPPVPTQRSRPFRFKSATLSERSDAGFLGSFS